MNTTNRTSSAPTTWRIDPIHTTVGFSVRHLMVTRVRGVFQQVTGAVTYDATSPLATAVDAEIPTASIHTREAQRDAHLRGPDFFDAEAHPSMQFRSKRARLADGGELEVTGDLTLRGTTREVVLAVREISGEQKDHNGATRMGATATGTLKRSDFGMTYNRVLEAGKVAISDEVTLTFDLSLVKEPAAR